jgi:hypothetical protein
MKVYGDNVFPIISGENFSKMSFLLNPYIFSSGGSGIPTENLILYLDANTEVYSDAGITLATDTDKVRQANDQSPQGNTMEQTSSAIQPSYQELEINGRNTVRSETNKRLDLTTDIVLNGGTIYLVGNKETTNGELVGLGHNTNSNHYFPLNWQDGNTYFHNGTAQKSISTSQPTTSAVRAYVWDYNVDLEVYTNKVSEGTVSAVGWGTFTGNCIMATTGFGAGFQEHAYILVYSDAHDATKVAEISDILNQTFSPTLY